MAATFSDLAALAFSLTGAPSQTLQLKSTPVPQQLRQHKTYLKVLHWRLEPELKVDSLSEICAARQSQLSQEGLKNQSSTRWRHLTALSLNQKQIKMVNLEMY